MEDVGLERAEEVEEAGRGGGGGGEEEEEEEEGGGGGEEEEGEEEDEDEAREDSFDNSDSAEAFGVECECDVIVEAVLRERDIVRAVEVVYTHEK